MKVPSFLRNLVIREVSGVDKGAGEGVRVVLAKRDGTEYDDFLKAKYSAQDRRDMAGKEAMADGSYPIKDADDLEKAIHAVGRGKNNSHEAIRRHVIARAKALGLSDKIPDDWSASGTIKKAIIEAFAKSGISLNDPDGDEGAQAFDDVLAEQNFTQEFWDAFYKGTNALQASLCSIVKDDGVTDKKPLIAQTLNEFADYIEGILPGDVGKALAAGIAAVAGNAGPTDKGATMSEAVKKALGLEATATEADVLAAIAKRDQLAKMSEKHKAFMDHKDAKLPTGGKDAFSAMTPAERDDHMDKNPIEKEPDGDEVEKALKSGDAFKAINGSVITKKAAGAMYDVLKSQDAEIRKSRDDIAKANEEKAVAQFEKRATDLGFAKEFGGTLRKAYSGDAAAQAEVEKQMAALRKQADEGGLFDEIGKRSVQTGTAHGELIAKRDELRKADPKLTEAQAFTKVYTDPANREIVKRYKAETGAPN